MSKITAPRSTVTLNPHPDYEDPQMYIVARTTNYTKLRPNAILSESQVEKLCERDEIEVVILPYRKLAR